MEQYRIPASWEGKTLKQIRDETNAAFRPDVLAKMLGINENSPLTRGQMFDTASVDPGSGEGQFLTRSFERVTADQLAKEYADQYTKATQAEIDREKKFVEEQLGSNPFAFDEQLAKESATAEYQPYYSELLQDYLGGVDLKRATVQDERQLAQDLYKLDTSARSRAYDRAVGQAEQGFAGQGLFYSGIKERTTGQQQVEYKSETEKAADQYGTGQAGYNRQLEGYGMEEAQQRRNIGREQETAVQSGILQRREEALKPYLSNIEQVYQRQFPGSTRTANQYLPSDYLRY